MTTSIGGTGQALGWRALQLGAAQGISLLRLLVLARIVAPDVFGLVAVAAVTVSLFMGLSNFGMTQALVQHPNPGDAEYDAAWTVGVLRAAVVTLALMAAGPLVATLYGAPAAGNVIRLLALRPLIDATGSIGVARLMRALGFRGIALMALAASLADAVTAIVLAPSLGVWALVAGTLTGAVVQAALSYAVAPHRPRFILDTRAATPLVRYGRWVLLTGIVSLAGTALVHMTLSRQLGSAALGTYYVAAKLAFMPAEVMAAVIGAVAFPLFASQRDDASKAAATFGAFLAAQVILLLPVCAAIIALAPELETALGARWAGAASTTQILAAACAIGVFGETVVPVLQGRGRADRVLHIELVQTIVQLALLIPLVGRFGVPGAALAWLGGNAISQVACAVAVRDVLRDAVGAVAWRRLTTALVSAVVAALAAIATRSLVHGFPALVAGSVAAGASASLILLALNQVWGLSLQDLLPWKLSSNLRPAAVRDAVQP